MKREKGFAFSVGCSKVMGVPWGGGKKEKGTGGYGGKVRNWGFEEKKCIQGVRLCGINFRKCS